MLNGGIDWQRQSTKPGTARLAKSHSSQNTGIYATSQQQLSDFILEAAVRSDKNSQFGWHSTWQGSAGWEFITDHRFIVGYGTAFKAPTLRQLYSARWGNPDVKPEESQQWELGLEGDEDPFNWRISAYRNNIDNMIEGDKNRGWRPYNIGKARIKGAELTGGLVTGPVNHQLSLSYVDPRNSQTNKVLNRRAKQKVSYQLDWQLSRLDLSLNYQYAGKRYDVDGPRTVRVGGYSVWDITVAYPIISSLTVRGRVSNLFDKNYETVYGYHTAGREFFLETAYKF
ncbi:MAG: TonB-dependent receptor domain-containing protein [Enterobacteriaceae bacterium]